MSTLDKNLILAIDTSCDDTSAAVVQGQTIISNVISSQIALHQPYGGVFPTVAKLAHQENIEACVQLALRKAGQVNHTNLTALAVTQGPGLAPALEVGINYAKEFSARYHLPLIPINHIEAHAWSSQLLPRHRFSPATPQNISPDNFPFPVISFVISGGHTQLILIKGIGDYHLLGSTLDDAAGECLDKIGRLLNLGYPAGPTIEQFAKLGDPNRFTFPLPLTTVKNFDFSFSGLKTFARNLIKEMTQVRSEDLDKLRRPNELRISKRSNKASDLLNLPTELKATDLYDLAASAQNGVFRHLLYKLNKLLETSLTPEIIQKENLPAPSTSPLIRQLQIQPTIIPPFTQLWLGGGVAANITLRRKIRQLLHDFHKKHPHHPPITLVSPYKTQFCGDNAAMIGLVAALKLPYAQTTHPDLFYDPDNLLQPLEREPNLPLSSWI